MAKEINLKSKNHNPKAQEEKRSIWLTVFFIYSIMITSFISGFIISPFIPDMLKNRFKLKPSEIGIGSGFITGAFELSQLISSFYLGHLSDLYGRRKILILSLVSSTVTMVMIGFAYSFWWVAFVQILSGLTNATYGLADAILGDLSHGPYLQYRSRFYGYLGATLALARALGSLTTSLTFDSTFGIHYFETNPYMFPCIVGSLISLLGTFVIVFFYKETNKFTRKDTNKNKNKHENPKIQHLDNYEIFYENNQFEKTKNGKQEKEEEKEKEEEEDDDDVDVDEQEGEENRNKSSLSMDSEKRTKSKRKQNISDIESQPILHPNIFHNKNQNTNTNKNNSSSKNETKMFKREIIVSEILKIVGRDNSSKKHSMKHLTQNGNNQNNHKYGTNINVQSQKRTEMITNNVAIKPIKMNDTLNSETSNKLSVKESLKEGIKLIFTNSKLLKLYIIFSLNNLSNGSLFTVLVLYASLPKKQKGLGFNPKEIGYIFVVYGVLCLFSQFFIVKRIINKLGILRTYVFGGCLLIILGCLFLAVFAFFSPHLKYNSSNHWLTWLLITIIFVPISIGVMTMIPILSTLISTAAGETRQGLVLGAGGSIGSIFRSIGPILGGAIFSFSTWINFPQLTFFFLVLMYLLCSISTFFMLK
ncbi:major facilitator superfamily domain-containing protein [Anaeramoeba flamelloides]|uniref:Major facilitator superfamily domain-containing protein n=1 Tax=Anaeramoeba flamelloides TaxID=1746091 RepID=A0AAV7ZAM0_9EUKA|nr:major facilitator superfamily domain-containing protein [Anaeramoeba flamelloides]